MPRTILELPAEAKLAILEAAASISAQDLCRLARTSKSIYSLYSKYEHGLLRTIFDRQVGRFAPFIRLTLSEWKTRSSRSLQFIENVDSKALSTDSLKAYIREHTTMCTISRHLFSLQTPDLDLDSTYPLAHFSTSAALMDIYIFRLLHETDWHFDLDHIIETALLADLRDEVEAYRFRAFPELCEGSDPGEATILPEHESLADEILSVFIMGPGFAGLPGEVKGKILRYDITQSDYRRNVFSAIRSNAVTFYRFTNGYSYKVTDFQKLLLLRAAEKSIKDNYIVHPERLEGSIPYSWSETTEFSSTDYHPTELTADDEDFWAQV